MGTGEIIIICIAALFGIGWITAEIGEWIRGRWQSKIDLATQQTATARANADREEAATRGKEADVKAESERTEQARLRAAERKELIELGRLRVEAEHASSGTVATLPISKSGGI